MENYSFDISILKQHLQTWDGLQDDQVTFERLAGLSNLIWKVTALSDKIEPKSVVYRKFTNDSKLINRSMENLIFSELSKAGLGPRCLGYSNEYRIEEYYDCDGIADSDIRETDIRRKLARNLAALHSVKMTQLEEKPYLMKNIEDGCYFNEVEKKIASTDFDESEQKIISEIQKALFSKDEVEFIMSIMPKSAESVTFSHNDLHSGNVLRLKQTSEYIFIDYEYSNYNYRCFDIANLFVETALDYSHQEYPFYKIREELYPPISELEDFVKYYTFFKAIKSDLSDEEADLIIKDAASLDEYLKKSHKLLDFRQEVDQIMHEVSIGKLLSHYHWTIWSIIFSKNKDTKFDYISYAAERLKLYEKSKAEFLAENVKIENQTA